MNLSACWSEIDDVDVEPMAAWLAANALSWPEVAPTKPQRIFLLGKALQTLIDRVMTFFDESVYVYQPMLSRMPPGESHPMHADAARADWVTRVHVPLVTNDYCWFSWEDESEFPLGRAYFAVGKAYTFDMTRRHAFGNSGDTERVHLIFDVLRRD